MGNGNEGNIQANENLKNGPIEITDAEASKYTTEEKKLDIKALVPAVVKSIKTFDYSAGSKPERDTKGKEYHRMGLQIALTLSTPIEGISEVTSTFGFRLYVENSTSRIFWGTEKSGCRKLVDVVKDSFGLPVNPSIDEIKKAMLGKTVMVKSEPVFNPETKMTQPKIFIKQFKM
ncbi:MAG: hypothetical protein WC451_02620 [Patescibacteria group bacterium]